jgi:protein phosphatase
MRGKMDCHGITDVGKVRETNQDQFLIADLAKSMMVHRTSLALDDQTRLFGGSQGKLLLVADGMGGHAGGERASRLVVDSVATYVLNTMQWFFRLDEGGEDDFKDDLKAALEHCQATVDAETDAIPDRQGMGTTLTMAYIIWPRMYVVHVGDSRCYLMRSAELQQLTKDHTVAHQLVEEGVLAAENEDESKWSNVLWNVIGGDVDELSPEVLKTELVVGDTMLLCTDGLTKHVTDGQIAECLSRDLSAQELCDQLVDAANLDGGSDNVTVVIARFREAAPQEDAADEEIELEDDQPRSQSEACADTSSCLSTT